MFVFLFIQVTDMLSGPLEGCYSSLMHDDGKGLRGLVLTLVALKVIKSALSLFVKVYLTKKFKTNYFSSQFEIGLLSFSMLMQG